MGIFFCATRGTGKSRALGRIIAWGDFVREIPLVIMDPVGGTIDNLLDKIGRQPLAVRRKLWKRVVYINMNGQDGRIFPWPVYYEAKKGERFSEQSKRFVSVVARDDADLRHASIYGMNSLGPIAKAAGIVLRALGLGITEMSDLVRDPKAWEKRFEELEQTHPETKGAIARLRALGDLTPRDRAAQTYSLLSKLAVFEQEPQFRASFGATTPGINWDEVVKKKQAVLIDFRDVDDEVKRFCLLWVYNSFVTFIKQRGHGMMRHPVSFVIDELSYMTGSAADTNNPLIGDIDELINRIARSHGVWLTLATQELFQLPGQIRQTVQSMGTVILGQTSDPEAAQELARRYFPYDPYWWKTAQDRWGRKASPDVAFFMADSLTFTYFTRDEQLTLKSRDFLNLMKFHFLVGQSKEEGKLPTTLLPVSIEGCDPGEFPARWITDSLRAQLMRRDGLDEQRLLDEIDGRLLSPRTGPQLAPPEGKQTESTTEPPASPGKSKLPPPPGRNQRNWRAKPKPQQPDKSQDDPWPDEQSS